MMVHTVIGSNTSEMVNRMAKDPEATVNHHGNVIHCLWVAHSTVTGLSKRNRVQASH